MRSTTMNVGDRWRQAPLARSLALLLPLLLALAAMQSPVRAALEIVVPAYFYPGGGGAALWTQMNAAAGQVPLTAIMNPGNGPGNSLDSNYVSAVNALRASGGRVIGYVYSSYGSRPLAHVLADIDKFDAWYDIDGIFVDEMANTGPAERLNYYKAIYDHVKGIDPQWEVMGNPGTTTIEQYFTWPAVDRLMVFENVGANYPPYSPSTWNFNYDSERFVHLVHTEPSSTNMLADLNLALAKNAGGIYITDDVLGNPWNTLPTYWQTEVNRVEEINSTFLAADFTENGNVGASDLTRWRSSYGAPNSAGHTSGDADGDGDVDGADFLVWQQQLGQTSLATEASQQRGTMAPEPTAVAHLGFAWGALISTRLSREHARRRISGRRAGAH